MYDCSRQLSNAEQDPQLLRISHVPEVLRRLRRRSQAAERSQQRDGRHQTGGASVQDFPWRPAFLRQRARRFRSNEIDESRSRM
jgi:hypothetical protein